MKMTFLECVNGCVNLQVETSDVPILNNIDRGSEDIDICLVNADSSS